MSPSRSNSESSNASVKTVVEKPLDDNDPEKEKQKQLRDDEKEDDIGSTPTHSPTHSPVKQKNGNKSESHNKDKLNSKSKPANGELNQPLSSIFNIQQLPTYTPYNLPRLEGGQNTMGGYLAIRLMENELIDIQKFGMILSSLPATNMQAFTLREKLTQDNYKTWSKLMQSKFRIAGLNVFLINRIDPKVRELNEFTLLAEILRDHLISNISSDSPNLLHTVLDARDGVAAWFDLESVCMGNSYVRGTAVIHKLHKLYEQKSTDVAYVVNEFKSIMDELAKMFKIDSEDGEVLWINYLLTLLPPNFMFVSSIIRNEKYTKLADVYRHILDEYQVYQQGAKSGGGINSLHTVKQKKKFQQKKEASGGELKCTYCKKSGHEQDTCFKRLRDLNDQKKKSKSNSRSHQTNAITLSSNEVVRPSLSNAAAEHAGPSLTGSSSESVQTEADRVLNEAFVCNLQGSNDSPIADPKKYTILDGGTSLHSVSTLAGCVMLTPITGVASNVANGQGVQVVGIGTYLFKTTQNTYLKLENVHYAPDLTSNYISHGLLKRNGYKTVEVEDGFELYKDGKFVVRATMNDLNHFELDGDWVSSQICSVIRSDVRNLTIDQLYKKWHNKLGHLCFGYLIKMKEQLSIKKNPTSRLKCNDCIINKCKRPPFKKRKQGVDRPLRLVHSDVCGQIDVPNLLRVRYFVTFKDDYSGHLKLYLMKKKSEVLDNFKIYKAYMEKQTGHEIMSIRTDGGGEYTSNQFIDLLQTAGIDIQRTCRDSPQMNGVAERVNQTLINMAKTMIHAAGLKVEVWPYALKFAEFVLNMVITAATNFQIPLFRLHNCNPTFDEIIEFGAWVVAVNLDKSHKFAPNGLVGRFLGYPDDHDGKLIYLEKERKVLISRDVYLLDKENCGQPDPDLENFRYFPVEYSNSVVAGDQHQSEPEEEPFIYPIPRLIRPASDCPTAQTSSTSTPAFVQQPVDNSPAESSLHSEAPNLSRPSDTGTSSGQQQLKPIRIRTGETFADLAPGSQITLNFEEEKRFREQYPDRLLVKGRYVNNSLPGKHRSFVYVNAIHTPKSFNEAVEGPDAAIWAPAILEEYNNWERLDMFERVPRPKDQPVIGLMWVFATKYDTDGTLEKAKARLCALGNRQKVNFNEIDTYAPVIRPVTLRMMFSLMTKRRRKGYHVDIKAAFLNSRLKQPVYCYPPHGFENPDRPDEVWLLRGAAYGLRESAKAWNDRLDEIMREYGLKPTLSDPCLYQNEDRSLLIGTHVDDLLILVESDEQYSAFAEFLRSKLEITEKGEVRCFLGYELHWKGDRLLINQRSYIKTILERFGFSTCSAVNSPMVQGQDLEPTDYDRLMRNRSEYQELCGALMYLANGTGVDITYAVNRLCRYMSKPTERHFECLKRLLRYLKGTIDHSLVYTAGDSGLVSYADADFANDHQDSKSIAGTCTFLYDNLIDWSSRRQTSVAISTCEAETLATRNESCYILFMRGLLKEIGLEELTRAPTTIYTDSLSALLTLKDGGAFNRNCHYRIRINFLRDLVKREMIIVKHLPGEHMVADLLTKPVGPIILEHLLSLINFGTA